MDKISWITAMDESLTTLHASIAARVDAIVSTHGDWPCRKGCDLCCRTLAAEPQLTRSEWQLLEEGLNNLPGEVRAAVDARIAAVAAASRPIVCPMLDPASGACLVYSHRPVACRTYGFYVERDKGLFCGIIERMSAAGDLDSIVWGNEAAIERTLRATGGPALPLSHWRR